MCPALWLICILAFACLLWLHLCLSIHLSYLFKICVRVESIMSAIYKSKYEENKSQNQHSASLSQYNTDSGAIRVAHSCSMMKYERDCAVHLVIMHQLSLDMKMTLVFYLVCCHRWCDGCGLSLIKNWLEDNYLCLPLSQHSLHVCQSIHLKLNSCDHFL